MSPQGVYPAADVCALGDEISSTYEGRHVTLYGDNISHGSQVSYVTKGYGVWSTHAVGMPFTTQTAALGNPLMTFDTEGIWCVDVHGANDGGDEAVAVGEAVYINTTTGQVSKIRDNATQLPFGYALGVVASGEIQRVAVKVHWDPISHTVLDVEKFYFGDDSDVTIAWVDPYLQFRAIVATPNHVDGEGLFNYALNVTGIATGEVNMTSHWINLTGAADIPGYMHVHTDGIWGSAADLATAYIAWAKISWMLPENPAGLYLFELNNGTAFDTLDAIFAVNNPALALGYIAATPTAEASGSIPFMAGAGGGGGLKWIRTYDDATT